MSSFLYLHYPLEESIKRIAAAGYDAIDIWGGRPHAYRRDLTRDEITSLRCLLSETGLSIASYIPAQFRYPTCLCSPIPVIRNDSVRYICEGIDTAAELGAPIVSVCPGHSLFGQSLKEARSCLVESLGTIGLHAQKCGIRIAIEPADRYETDLIYTTAEAVALIKEMGQAGIGVVLDNGHCQVVGESAARAARELGRYLYHVHLDDNDGLRDQHLVPGEGKCDISSFMVALAEMGYPGYVTAELGFDYTQEPDKAASLTLARMRAYSNAAGYRAESG